MISVTECGALGDGLADDAPAIQRALDQGSPEVRIPAGTYRLGHPLRIGSGTALRLDRDATLRLADGVGPRAGADGFLLANRDPVSGNHDITIEGGTWDANNPGNPRGPDGPRDSYTGVAVNFVKVRGLILREMIVRDPESFFIRLGEVQRFLLEKIRLEAPHVRPNQDGIHLGGFCEDGTIRHVRAVGPCCPNDDMVALNANDDVGRAINLGMKEGPIRRITVEDLAAEDAYTFVRILSQEAPVEEVCIRGIRGACRYYALNLNRWRFPPGKGHIARVVIEDVEVARHPSPSRQALIHVTLAVQNLEIRNFRRLDDASTGIATLELNNGTPAKILLEGLDPSQRAALQRDSTLVLETDRGTLSKHADCFKAMGISGEVLRLPAGGFQRFAINAS